MSTGFKSTIVWITAGRVPSQIGRKMHTLRHTLYLTILILLDYGVMPYHFSEKTGKLETGNLDKFINKLIR
jgi:hypothetical protein